MIGALRNELVERHLGIAYHLAHRYRHRGVADEDLVQVATIGLLKSVERFDPERGSSFGAFATPTILGELRRYFRDATWALRVPRQLQERVLAVSRAVGPLTQQLGRSPSPKEIAREADLSEEEVLEALEADGAYGTSPLDSTSDVGYRVDKSVDARRRSRARSGGSSRAAPARCVARRAAHRPGALHRRAAIRARPDAVADRRPHRRQPDARLTVAELRARKDASPRARGDAHA